MTHKKRGYVEVFACMLFALLRYKQVFVISTWDDNTIVSIPSSIVLNQWYCLINLLSFSYCMRLFCPFTSFACILIPLSPYLKLVETIVVYLCCALVDWFVGTSQLLPVDETMLVNRIAQHTSALSWRIQERTSYLHTTQMGIPFHHTGGHCWWILSDSSYDSRWTGSFSWRSRENVFLLFTLLSPTYFHLFSIRRSTESLFLEMRNPKNKICSNPDASVIAIIFGLVLVV